MLADKADRCHFSNHNRVSLGLDFVTKKKLKIARIKSNKWLCFMYHGAARFQRTRVKEGLESVLHLIHQYNAILPSLKASRKKRNMAAKAMEQAATVVYL